MDRDTPTLSVDRPLLRDVVQWMRRFAHKGKADVEVRQQAEDIVKNLAQGDYASEALALYYWTCQHIRYIRDIDNVEFLKEPRQVLETGTGDCDDIATLLAAMLMSIGNRCRFVLAGFKAGGPPSHVYVEVYTPGGWVALDPVANRETGDMLTRERTRIEVRV